jgi:hypothetical protein
VRLRRRAVTLAADYRQFYLWDQGMTCLAPEEYTADDVRHRIKTGPHVVVIMPARVGPIPVEVEVHDRDPGFDPTEWDHIAEASLHLPTGRLQVHECTGGPVAGFRIAPGWYRVRSLHAGLATADDDRYRVVLWPAKEAGVVVVKQWE